MGWLLNQSWDRQQEFLLLLRVHQCKRNRGLAPAVLRSQAMTIP
jgi:hypothetical protein